MSVIAVTTLFIFCLALCCRSGECVEHDMRIARKSHFMHVQNATFCDLQTRLQMNQSNDSIKSRIIAFVRAFSFCPIRIAIPITSHALASFLNH